MNTLNNILTDAWCEAFSIESTIEYAKNYGFTVTYDQVKREFEHLDIEDRARH